MDLGDIIDSKGIANIVASVWFVRNDVFGRTGWSSSMNAINLELASLIVCDWLLHSCSLLFLSCDINWISLTILLLIDIDSYTCIEWRTCFVLYSIREVGFVQPFEEQIRGRLWWEKSWAGKIAWLSIYLLINVYIVIHQIKTRFLFQSAQVFFLLQLSCFAPKHTDDPKNIPPVNGTEIKMDTPNKIYQMHPLKFSSNHFRWCKLQSFIV